MIYGYIRVSTDKQNVENQEFEINKYCKDNNIVIDKWIKETISSTKKLEDRKLGKLLKHLDISGDSHNVFVGVSRRLAQGDDYRVYGDITLDFRNTDLSSNDNGLNSQLASLGIEGNYEGIGHCLLGYPEEEGHLFPRKENYVYYVK